MAKDLLRIIFSSANVVHFVYIIYFTNGLKIPGHRHNAFGGQWKFLTYWNLWLQLTYFIISLCNELFSPPKNDKDQEPSKLGKVRDFLFSTLAFPVGIFVTISFWLLYVIDRNLVFPPKLDEFYPLWANHMLHTTCTLSQLFEMKTSFHAYPSKAKGILTSIGFALIYLGWVLVIAFQANVWVYGVLQKLPPVGRTLFMGGCSMIFGIIYLLGEHLNGRIWAVKEDEVIVEESEANGSPSQEELVQHTYNTRSRKKVAKVD